MSEPDPQKMLDALDVAGAALSTALKINPKRGSFPCPLCKTGTITYAKQGPRSMQARCSTRGCIVMMS